MVFNIYNPDGSKAFSIESTDPTKSEEGLLDKLTGYVPGYIANKYWPDPESFLNANGVKQGLDRFIADVTKNGKFKIATMKDIENGKKAFWSSSIGHNEMIEKYGVVFVIAIPKYINTYNGTAGQADYADIRVKLVNTSNGKIEERQFAKCLFRNW